MAIATFNLTKRGIVDNRIVQGEDWSKVLAVIGDDTSWEFCSAQGQLRSDFKNYTAEPVAELTASIIDPTPGQQILQLSLSHDITAAIVQEEGRWDVEITDGEMVRRVVMGVWQLNLEANDD